MSIVERIAGIQALQRQALASANVLFQEPIGDSIGTRKAQHRDLLGAYVLALDAVERELEEVSSEPDSADRYFRVKGNTPDSIDYANQLIAMGGSSTFAERFSVCIWDAVRECLPPGIQSADEQPRLRHALNHANRLFEVGIRVLDEHLALLRELAGDDNGGALPRLDPAGFGHVGDSRMALDPDGEIELDKVVEALREHDLFSASRTYRPFHNELHPGLIGEIRSLENFYGYRQERTFFGTYFADFVAGKEPLPLLLSGMPGIGKTHLTIAHSLSLPEVTLVLADASYLEDSLEWLIDLLGQHHYRKFVLFFDDVEPSKVNWTTFRNQVDGFLPYAKNVCMVIAANANFPVSIRSRARGFDFRAMDPEVCQEFIADYIAERQWMSQAYPDLVSTVASDFVAMYRTRVLSELTPRSLVQYLGILEANKEKIKGLIRESLEDIVRVPAEEAFIESNRSILNQLRKSRGEPPLPPPGMAGIEQPERDPALPSSDFGQG